MWKAERMRRIGRKQYTDTDAIRGDGEGQNSRKEQNRRAENGQEQTENGQEQTENGQEQTETDGDGRRMFKNKFYVTLSRKRTLQNQAFIYMFSELCTDQIKSCATSHIQ